MHTKRGGAAAKAAHDLDLHVTSWEATLDLEAGTAELTADGSSLRVEKGVGGMMELTDEHKGNIHQTIDEEVLEKRNITFRSTSIAGSDGRFRVDGELSLAGRTEPLSFELVVEDGKVSGTATITQTRWGMKPFSALFGTLKVLDDVEVQLQSR